MRLAILGGAIAMLGSAWYFSGDLMRPRNTYAASAEQVHQLLATMKIPTDADGPLGPHPVTKTDDRPLAISWAGGRRGTISCTARIEPVSASSTRVAVQCSADDPDKRAALTLARIAMTEQVDSTLRGRPYNKQAVTIGASAVAAIAAVPDAPTSAASAQPDVPPSDAPPPPAPSAGDEWVPPPSPANQPVIDPTHVR